MEKQTEKQTAHPVVWFEVIGTDSGKLQRYYGDLFGWKINADNPMKYGMIEAKDGKGIPGGIGGVFEDARPWVTFYVECADIEGSLAKAEKLGGNSLILQRRSLSRFVQSPNP